MASIYLHLWFFVQLVCIPQLGVFAFSIPDQTKNNDRGFKATKTKISSPTQLRMTSGTNDLSSLVQEFIDSDRKIIVVTGGVLSGIGKGVVSSSLGVILRGLNRRVTALKIDPYLNVDAGTMSPFEHGEVFVLDDGGECDLDLGNYERFLSVSLTKDSNLSTGKIYQSVIEKERRGDYLGKTVQVVPHVSDAIQEWVLKVAGTPVSQFCTQTSPEPEAADTDAPEICVVELGGTLGDIESMPFVEALRQLQEQVGYKNMCFVHVSLVPVMGEPTEQKTKPTQHSVKQMRELGLTPDFIMCRGKEELKEYARKKISLMTSVREEAIVSVHDVTNIYHVPLMLLEQKMLSMLVQRLRIQPFVERRHSFSDDDDIHESCDEVVEQSEVIKNWRELARSVDEPEGECVIAIVGKYCDQGDAYLSVAKALLHSAIATKQKLRIEWIEASLLSPDKEPESESSPEEVEETWKRMRNCDGIVVPGGFGSRGIEGKITAIEYARTSKIPFLGICLGMQAAVIEYARNVLGRERAHSAEFVQELKKDQEDVVMFMPEGDRKIMGGTMRLGARETVLKKGSLAYEVYGGGDGNIMERHRHRYEVNPAVVPDLETSGLLFVGRNTDGSGERMEVIELDSKAEHPYFIAAQFHPEFTSRPEKPSPLFLGLLKASKRKHESKE